MDEIETAHFYEVTLIIKLKYSVAKFRSNFLPYDKLNDKHCIPDTKSPISIQSSHEMEVLNCKDR